jgi:peptidoglycan/xylan/chitin deacetylase (PgdA/CDA1 family)
MTWGFYGELRKIFLTFDDGPTPGVTEWVLDQLREYNAKATFFCIGRNVEHFPDTYHKILEEGHSVGNHTYSHLKGFRSGRRHYFEDVELASNFIDSDLFRPPYGRIRPDQVREVVKQYRLIMWDVLSIDYTRKVPDEEIVHNVTTHARSGSIVVFHDSEKARKNLYYALPRVLENLSRRGYEFEAIPMKKYVADRMWLKGMSMKGAG